MIQGPDIILDFYISTHSDPFLECDFVLVSVFDVKLHFPRGFILTDCV